MTTTTLLYCSYENYLDFGSMLTIMSMLLLLLSHAECFAQTTTFSSNDDGFGNQSSGTFTHEHSHNTSRDIAKCASSLAEFPTFMPNNGKGICVVAILIAMYCFTLLAIVCDSYFLPCVEKICDALDLSQDVAAATFMSIATSTPELFGNIIGTFVTKSDIGIGTVVGSSIFNALGVASLGGLAASTPIPLHWWPVTRDVIIYITALLLLVLITWDGLVYWYEGLVLFAIYFLYFTVMFQNARISTTIKRVVKNVRLRFSNQVEDIHDPTVNSNKRLSIAVISHYGSYRRDITTKSANAESAQKMDKSCDINNNGDIESNRCSNVENICGKFLNLYTLPIRLMLSLAIPNPIQHPKWYPLTFIMCICFIGFNSYIVSWMIVVLGNAFGIPDSVLGLTFLAAGGCLPEAISITIMSRRGEGSMGVSNSLGANTMNILLSLGLPWFVRTIMMGTDANAFIVIQSGAIEYTILGLIGVAFVLYSTLLWSGFKLSRTVGFVLLFFYAVFVVLAIMADLVFFPSTICIS